jgi:hypothetical protein
MKSWHGIKLSNAAITMGTSLQTKGHIRPRHGTHRSSVFSRQCITTLDLLFNSVYDEDTGIWYIETLSPALPLACLMSDGEIQPVELQTNDE